MKGTAEEKAIQSVIKLCNQTGNKEDLTSNGFIELGVRSHIVHLSAGTALDLLAEAQQQGFHLLYIELRFFFMFFSSTSPFSLILK